MSNYKRKEVFDYLTRKPVTTQDIELAKTRIQPPVTPAPMQVTSGEELGTREGFKLGTRGPIARILGKEIVTSENEYAKLKQFIIDTYSVNKDDPNLFPAIQKYSEKFGGNLSNTAENLGLDRKAMIQAGERRGFKFEGKGSTGTTKIKDLDYGDLTAAEFTNLVKENPNYLKQLIKDKKINPNEFYNAGDIAKIFGLEF
jgi:hypothetical protein